MPLPALTTLASDDICRRSVRRGRNRAVSVALLRTVWARG
jgi:hypothetical protein